MSVSSIQSTYSVPVGAKGKKMFLMRLRRSQPINLQKTAADKKRLATLYKYFLLTFAMVPRCLRLPLDQNSNLVFIWDSLQCAAIHASYIFVWFQAAIDASVAWQLATIYALDCFYLLYVLSQFITSYKDKGRTVKSYKKIGRQVVKLIILDILSLLPLEVFSFLSSQQVVVAAYLRLNRSLRFFRVFKFFSRMESNIMTSSFFWASMKAVSASLLSMHLWSCVWYMIACDNVSDGGYCTNDTWANTDNLDYGIDMNEAGSYRRYLASYYWSITTITTLGYGEIHPQSWKERLTALICMIVECTKLSVILGNLAALLTNKESKVGAFKYHLKVVQEHMLNMTLPETLRKRVVDRYEYMWKQSRGEEIEKLLLMLPPNLQTALFTETHQEMLNAIAMQFMQRNSVHYLRQLSQMIKPTIYLPGEIILKKGEFGDGLCFLQRGHIEVVDGTGQVRHLIQSGDSFGKVNLLFKVISAVTLRAGSLCELAILSTNNFCILEKYYPIIGLQLRTTLRTQFAESCAHVKESLKNYKPENSLLDDYCAEGEEEIHEKDVEKNQIKYFSKKDNIIWRYIRKLIDVTVTPGSRFYVFWNGFMFITILITVWIYCYLAAFTRFKPSISYENHRVGFAFTYLIDLLFVVDMIVSMKIAYEGANAIIIDQPWSVFKHYVQSWKFLLDVLAILPVEMFSLVWTDPWNYIAVYKLNRILKWWRLWHILEDDLANSVRVSSSKVHFLRMLVYIPTITHIGACAWFALACFHEGKCLKDSWAQQQGLSINNSALHDYVISLYWSTTTMTSVGYGDITPYNDRDKILAIIAMIVGTLLYGYILGAVAATLTSAFASKVAFQERLRVVKDFVAQHTSNKQLSKRIHHHYNLLWKQSRGEANYIAMLLSNLPESLREEVLLADLQETIENIPWFSKAEPSFLKKLASNMTLYQYSPGDFIMYHGDIYNEMYCVRKGIVEVLSEDLSHVVAKLGIGGYFGELCLLGKSRSTITARAATHCEILGIDRDDLENIVNEFPIIQRQLQKIILEYRKKQMAGKLAALTCRNVKIPPRNFVKHDTFSALAIAMTVPVNIITRQSILPKVVASFTDSKIRRKLACPLSTVTYPDVTFLRHKSSADKVLTLDEIGIAVKRGKQAQLMKLLSNRRRESQIEGIADDYRRSTMYNQSAEIARQYSGKFKHHVGLIFSLIMVPYVLLPKSRASVVWEVLICLLGLSSCVAISLQASFFISSRSLWTINYIIDAFFYIDMFIKLHTAYFNAEGILVTAPVKCAVNYFKTNFLLDLLSNFPTELISLAIWNGDNLLTMLSLIRLNRLVRAYKLVILFEYLEDRVSLSTSYFKMAKFFIFIAIGTHWISCYWFMVTCSNLTGSAQESDGEYTCTTDGWALQETALTPFDSNDSTYRRYVTTVYWASASSTTVGYGDIIAYTDFERLYALSIMIVSVISYGYMLGSIAASLTNTASTYSAFKEKVSAVKVYLKDNKVDSSVIQRVVKHYEYLWQKRKGVDLQNIFEGLPVSLKADLALNLHKDFIEQIPVFKNTDATFLKLIALACKPVYFLSGQSILKKGDMGNAMYFISKGEVEILSGKHDTIRITQIGAGNFFGEISCFLGCLITATVKAKTNCELFVLTKDDLKQCLRHYPHVAEHIITVAKERYDLVKSQVLSANSPAEDHSTNQLNQSQNDDKERSKQSFINQWLIIDPESYVGLTVSAIGHILTLLSSLILSYQATFVDTGIGWYVVTYLAEVYFIIDLVLNFFTIKYDKDGNKITDSKEIVVTYLKKPNGFMLDLFLLMPFEVFALPISNEHTRTVTLLWLRTHRMIRMLRLLPFIRAHSQQFKTLMSIHFVAIAIQCGLLLTLSTHWCACLWYIIACPGGECHSETWADSVGITNSSDYHYLTSLYWSVTTLTTTGYGEISATNTLEMIVSSSIMIIGKLIFGFILGNVASNISNWNKNEVEFKGKVAAVKKYMRQKKISPSLQTHVLEYLDYIWARKRNVHYHTLLNDMSFCMQAEIAMAGTEGLLRKVPLFVDIDEAFLRRLSLTLKKFFYLPNQYIVVTRDINYDLYIVQEGNVRVFIDTSSHQTLLSSGGYFGLNSFYSKHQKEVTAIAINHVDIIVVRKTEFDQLVELYPNVQQHLDDVVAYYGLLPSFGQTMDVIETTV